MHLYDNVVPKIIMNLFHCFSVCSLQIILHWIILVNDTKTVVIFVVVI